MTNYVVYLLTFPNGKRYVGKTNDWKRRWRGHKHGARYGSRMPVHSAMRKYGFDSVKVEFVAFASNRDELIQLEKEQIALLNTQSPVGYNLTTGGEGNCDPSLETRRRMSEAGRGRKKTESHRRKIAEASSRHRHSAETRAKLSAIAKARHAADPKLSSYVRSFVDKERLRLAISESNKRRAKKDMP